MEEQQKSDELQFGDPNDEKALQQKRIKFGRRFGAYMLDYLAISIIVAILAPFLLDVFVPISKTVMESQVTAEEVNAMDQLPDIGGYSFLELMIRFTAMGLISNLVTIVYFLMEAFLGAAVGKLLLGIRIAHESGVKAPMGQLFWRYALKASASVIALISALNPGIILGSINSLWSIAFLVSCILALTEKRQALHDMIAKTAVYWKRDLDDAADNSMR